MSDNTKIEDFSWDENSFFGVTEDNSLELEEDKLEEHKTVENAEEDEEGKDLKKDEEEDKEKEDKSKEEVDLGVVEDEDLLDEEEKINEEPNQNEDKEYWKNIYSDFKETGLLRHVEIPEDEEIDEEKFLELQEQDYEEEVKARLVNWAENELDEDAKTFIKFKKDGGKTQDFFNIVKEKSKYPTGELTDEKYQDEVIKFQLKQEGWDDDEIQDRLEYLDETGRKSKVAERYDKKIKEKAKKEEESKLEEAKKEKENKIKEEKEFVKELKTSLDSLNSIKGVVLTNSDKSGLLSMLTAKKKVGDKIATDFQIKLSETFKDQEKMLLLAKLLKEDFNLDRIYKQYNKKENKKTGTRYARRKKRNTSSSNFPELF